ncbi:hypothetical protein KJ780_03410 [Candidatus Micrarchaeota archaeon]|nr:hypothetical protein [Candidatus Micrarchaeota archaeon]
MTDQRKAKPVKLPPSIAEAIAGADEFMKIADSDPKDSFGKYRYYEYAGKKYKEVAQRLENSDPELAALYFGKAGDAYEQATRERQLSMASVCYEHAADCIEKKNPEKAAAYYVKAAKVYAKNQDAFGAWFDYNKAAETISAKDPKKALEYFKIGRAFLIASIKNTETGIEEAKAKRKKAADPGEINGLDWQIVGMTKNLSAYREDLSKVDSEISRLEAKTLKKIKVK